MRSRVLVACAGAALLLGACGSSGSTGGSSPSPTAGTGPCALDEPVRMAFTWEVAGESAVAVSDYDNAARLAVDELNAAGGVCGQPIVAERFSTSTTDPQKAIAAYLQAVDTEPSIILGMGAQGIIDAARPEIERNGIPTIALSPNDTAVFGSPKGSEFLWLGPAPSGPLAEAAATYALTDLNGGNAGFLGTNESFGNDALAAIESVYAAKGTKLSVVRQHSPGASELTEQVLAMKGVDVVFDFGYPNDIGVAIKQMSQNGITVPVIDGASAEITALYGLVPPADLSRLYAAIDCTAASTTRPQMRAFTDAYVARYGQPLPFAFGVVTYDMVKLGAKAIERAGSADPAKVNEAIGQLTYADGACHPEYRADGGHSLAHSGIVARFAGDGTAATVKELTIRTVAEGGRW